LDRENALDRVLAKLDDLQDSELNDVLGGHLELELHSPDESLDTNNGCQIIIVNTGSCALVG
jgi:hypothetical protein